MRQLLEVRNLCISFTGLGKTIPAVQGISYTVREGEVVAIVGESGSGKSVASKAILGLNPPLRTVVSGEIYYKGVDLLTLSSYEQQKIRGKEIGIIFQDPNASLNPTMRVGAQILESYQKQHRESSKKESLKKVYELLELVRISDPEMRYNQYPHELSGGLQQRVMIAIALAGEPRLLIADEPTTALDVTTQAQILDLLKELQTTLCMSIIFITHDLRLASSFSSKTLVLHKGELVEMGPTKEIFLSPQHPYTQKLLASISLLSPSLKPEPKASSWQYALS